MPNEVDSTSTDSAVGTDQTFPSSSQASLWGRVVLFGQLIRFSHTVFALPFALLACTFALIVPRNQPLTTNAVVLRLSGVLLCMVTARSAAMAFNRLADARFDGQNPRTARRHLPSGSLTSRQVWMFCVASAVMFVGSCLLFLPNWLPLAGAIPVLLWICGYSFAKRFTSAVHLWLGVALALSPICAWLAVRGEQVVLDAHDLIPAIVLAAAIAVWVAGFDIIYSCQDQAFDVTHGLHSVPAALGIAGALRIAFGLHILMLAALAVLPFFKQLQLGWLYWVAYAGVAVLVVAQHALVKPHDLARVNAAFFHVNAALSLGFCLLAAVDAANKS